MALKKCIECNKDIGGKVKKCPHCGTTQGGTSLTTVILAFFFAAIFFIIVHLIAG